MLKQLLKYETRHIFKLHHIHPNGLKAKHSQPSSESYAYCRCQIGSDLIEGHNTPKSSWIQWERMNDVINLLQWDLKLCYFGWSRSKTFGTSEREITGVTDCL